LNNLDPGVAEKREELIVNVGSGKAERNPECPETILASLERLGDDETLGLTMYGQKTACPGGFPVSRCRSTSRRRHRG
jgi:urocanate hydratase